MQSFDGNGNDIIYAGFVNYKSIYNDYQPQISNAPIKITCCGNANYQALLYINFDSKDVNASIDLQGARYTVNKENINIYTYNDVDNYRIIIGVKYNGKTYIDGLMFTPFTPVANLYASSRVDNFGIVKCNDLEITQRNALYGTGSMTVPYYKTNVAGIVVYGTSDWSSVKIGCFFSVSESVVTSTSDFTVTRDSTKNVIINFPANQPFEVMLMG